MARRPQIPPAVGALLIILLIVFVIIIALRSLRPKSAKPISRSRVRGGNDGSSGAGSADPGPQKPPSPNAAAISAADKDHFFRTYDLTGAVTPGRVDPYTGLSWYNREEFADREKRGTRALKDELSILKLGLLV